MSLNVFAGLELPKPDEHFLKAGLLVAIADIIRRSGLTQTEIAQRTGLNERPRESEGGVKGPPEGGVGSDALHCA